MNTSEDLAEVSSEEFVETLYDLLYYGNTLDSAFVKGMERDGAKVWELVLARTEGAGTFGATLDCAELSVAAWGRILMFDIGKENRLKVLDYLAKCANRFGY